jgi:hypothetical protein
VNRYAAHVSPHRDAKVAPSIHARAQQPAPFTKVTLVYNTQLLCHVHLPRPSNPTFDESSTAGGRSTPRCASGGCSVRVKNMRVNLTDSRNGWSAGTSLRQSWIKDGALR